MEIQVADQRIFVFKDTVTPTDAKQKAWNKKMSAFDSASKVIGFLTRAKDEDFELAYHEHRYQPFWHVIAQSKYVYDRSADYHVPATGTEVKSLTHEGKEYPITNGAFRLSTIEHCTEEQRLEVLVDGMTGTHTPELLKYLSLSPQLFTGELATLADDTSIVVPPHIRVSAIMRDTLAKMIKGIQADKILEESVAVTAVDLYYRPIYAFQYHWISKDKKGIVEVDGLTGEVMSGTRVFSEYLNRALDRDFLFDLGADATGMLIPGGNIAVKVVKRYLDKTK